MPSPASIFALPLILLVSSSLAMAPAAFELRLQKGILGGFIPPRPTAIYTVTRDNAASSIEVTVQTAENSMEPASKEFPVKDYEARINRILGILKQLPTENPPQSEDIFGLNIGISWMSDDFQWVNSAPQGCIPGISDKPATDEEKVLFEEAVDIVTDIADPKGTDEL
ncbi:hypothetical protein PT974_05566 [Cladobotryum mycophilum]|uniref:Uncharacterized protein n=1 Tax=Cladobotryum mycophilum TaxID=491253 RepID=A0ABR0SKB5_9HYPO